MLVDINGRDRLVIHIDIPDLQSEVVARKDVPAIVAKLDIRDRGNYL